MMTHFKLKNSNTPAPKVDQKLIDSMLNALINGASCSEAMTLSRYSANEIWAKNGDKINAQKDKGSIRFEGRLLKGGIWNEKTQNFIDASRHFTYALKNNTLEVSSVCQKQSFSIINYDKDKESFGIKLGFNPLKEVAVVINVASSMRDYVLALKEIALYLADHLLKSEDVKNYGLISLVSFAYYQANYLGTFNKAQDFADAVNKLTLMNAPTMMVNYALIEAMKHFTKDNGLKKEIYLISDGNPVDMRNSSYMLSLTQNLNRNIVKNSGGCEDNCVKIHSFALGKDLDYIKNLAQETKGKAFEISSVLDFKKSVLVLSNDGKAINPKEIGNEIIPSKTHKIYDPDDPDDNPPF